MMMAAILNSTILDSAILVFPLKLTHTCQDWFPPFAQKNLHSIILTQLDDGSHLEFCHVGFRHLVFFSQIHSKTLSLHSDSWLKLIQSDSNSFILTQLDEGSHLEFYHVGLKNHLGFSHLEFFPLGFKPCFLSQIDSKLIPTILTLTQTNLIWLKLIHSDSTWWWQPSWILPSWIWPSWIQPLSFSSQTHSHLPRLVPTICTKKNLHSFILTQTWWWQPSWILPCWIQLCHLGFRHLLIFILDSLKNTLTPLWLWTQTYSIWLKLIHSHSTWWWQPSWILPSWIWPSWIQPS